MQAQLYINARQVVSSATSKTFTCKELTEQIENTEGVGTSDWYDVELSYTTMTTENINAALNCLASPQILSDGLKTLKMDNFGAESTGALSETVLDYFLTKKDDIKTLSFSNQEAASLDTKQSLLKFAKKAIMQTPMLAYLDVDNNGFGSPETSEMLRYSYSYPTDTLLTLSIAGADFSSQTSCDNLATLVNTCDNLARLDISNQQGTRTVTLDVTLATSAEAMDGTITVRDASDSSLITTMSTGRTLALTITQ